MVLKKTISERELDLPKIEMGKLLKIAVEKKDIISLGPGEPDFIPSDHIIRAAQTALRRGYTHYSPPRGRSELLEALSNKLINENNIKIKPDEIVVTCGSTEAIMLALISTIDPGEAVLIPDPGYISYKPLVEMLNGYPIPYKLDFRTGFQVDIDNLAKIAKGEKIRTIIINSPSNPTGTVFRRKILEEIGNIAKKNDLLIISDEAYEKFVYKGKHISIGSLKGLKNRVLTLQSFSKTYGMAGFRVGYAAGPKKMIDAMVNLRVHSTICSPTVSQLAAFAALNGSQASIKRNVKEYDRRRRYMVDRVNEIDGLSCNDPEGAFYVFARIDKKIKSLKLCEKLLKSKVAVVPGKDFGRYGEGFIRLSFATSYKLIVEGMNRIEKAMKRLK